MIIAPGATSVSIDVQFLDDDGLAVTGKVAADFPACKWSAGTNVASATITLSDLAAITTAHPNDNVAGGVKEREGGWYRLDLPNTVGASAVNSEVTITFEETTNKRIIAPKISVQFVKSDVTTIKTQTVTCAAPVTVLASVGTAATSTAQTGDSFALIGTAGAGLTNIVLPSGGLANISTWTVAITGNLSGSVGSVTGAVGSVTGAVGSVTGAVGSVTGNVGGNVTGSVGSISGITFPSNFSVLSITGGGLVIFANTSIGTVTTLTNLPSIPAGWLTTAGIADGAFTAAKFAAAALNGKGDWMASFAQRSGTAAAGGLSGLTLDAGASAVDQYYRYATLVITGGTGAGQARQITNYIGASRVAGTDGWATATDATSTFIILPMDLVHLHATQTYSNIGNLTGNIVGNVTGNVTGNVGGNVNGNVLGNVDGHLGGNVVGNVNGSIGGNLGDFSTTIWEGFFTFATGKSYGDAVAQSIVKEIADNAFGTGAGAGAYPITVTVIDAGAVPVQNAIVRVSQGVTSNASPTDVNGEVIFQLDSGTWNGGVTKSGYIGQAITGTVTGIEAGTLVQTVTLLTSTPVTPPANPLLCAVVAYIINGDGTPAVGVVLKFKLKSNGFALAGSIVVQTEVTSLPSDVNGRVDVTLVRNDAVTSESKTTWLVTCDEIGLKGKAIYLASPTYDLLTA